MKKFLLVLTLIASFLMSCNRFKKGEGGMLYRIYTSNSGPTIKEGDFLAVKVIQKTQGDSVIFSSYDYDRPTLLVQRKPLFKGDIYAGLAMLHEGDSATFKISLDSMEKKMGQTSPTKKNKDKYMAYTIKVDKIIPKGKLKDSVFRSKVDAFITGERGKAKAQEPAKLNHYIEAKGLKPNVTASGLQYVIIQQGNGIKANPGDTAEVNYVGSFLSGKVFDTNVASKAKAAGTFNAARPYAPIKMSVGTQASIPGFDEALLLFPKGTKATIILPSALAYGEVGNMSVPPYTPLVFDIEIVNVIPKKASSAAPVPERLKEKKKP